MHGRRKYGQGHTRRPRRLVARALATVSLPTILTVLVPAIAVAVGFSATLIDNANSFSSGNLVLQATTPVSVVCTSSTSTITTDAATCVGNPVPAGTLSTTNSTASSTVASLGSLPATTANLSSTGCGVQQFADSSTTGTNTALPFYGVTYANTMTTLSSTAAGFNGSTGFDETLNSSSNPENFTITGWFNTSSDQGTLIGFSATQYATNSTSNDRELWINSTGHLVWATATNATTRTELTSTTVVANGAWHFFTVTVGTAVADRLYVDGALQASATGTTAAYNYTGYWHLGWGSELDGTPAWTGTPTSAFFNGDLAGVAVIPSQLGTTVLATFTSNVAALYATTSQASYNSAISAYSPTSYWPLNDSGQTAFTGTVPGLTASTPTFVDDSGNTNTGTLEGTATLGAPGPLAANAVTLNGTPGNLINTTTSYTDPDTTTGVLSQSIWFKTAATGSFMGFTTNQTDSPTPGSYDRLFWIDSTGHLVYGVYSAGVAGSFAEVVSPGTYNNNAWHLAVATVGSSGETLYVDGVNVGNVPAATTAQNFIGYWHLGYGYNNLWPDATANYYFNGSLAQAAVYPTQLNSTQASSLYSAGSLSAEESAILSLSPTSYWPLNDTSSSSACAVVETTIQATKSAVNTCVYPAGPGSCPAPSASILANGIGSVSMPTPTATASVTLLVTMRLTVAQATGVAGLHLLVPIDISSSNSNFTSALNYPLAVTVI